ncbi:MAG: 16S rRNA (uracil(1498)-N(3))-methyltransferase [Desulfatibacillaceae bacterium]
MRRFFVEPGNVDNHTAVIFGPEARHVKDVLRLRPGAKVVVFDGTGREYAAVIESCGRGEIRMSLLEERSGIPESRIRITLAVALVKGAKMDLVVRAGTELGVAAFQPVPASRSVPGKDRDKLAPRIERWERIAIEAAKQCGRSAIPEVLPLAALESLPGAAEGFDVRILFHEKNRGPGVILPRTEAPSSVYAVVGPEGGFAPDEASWLLDNGFAAAGMGPRILRAETAAIAACVLLQTAYGDMGAPDGPHS